MPPFRRAAARSMAIAVFISLAWWGTPAGGEVAYGTFFTGSTMRIDYFHSGTAGEEHVSLDEIREEGPWPGNPNSLIDLLGFGKYFFRVFDLRSQDLIFSGGFASIYGEWETTGEAAEGTWRTFHESIRFPFPKAEIQVVLLKRRESGAYNEIASFVVDPNSRFVKRTPVRPAGKTWQVVRGGDSARKVDVVFLPDGYTEKEMSKFHRDAEKLAEFLFRVEPFKSRKSDFNIWAVDVPSPASGIDNPRAGVFLGNALGSTFNSFDTDRYVLSFDNREIRDVASAVPYEFTILVCNVAKYGGGGIYRLYATTVADNVWAEYLFTHEFGHHFAALGDEYFTSSVAYLEEEQGGFDHPDPNITSLHDPENVKWGDLIEEGTPLPTPWNKSEYEKLADEYGRQRQAMIEEGAPEEERDKLSLQNAEQVAELLRRNEYLDQVGVFEGAGYARTGLYRPSVDCRMFRKGLPPFCPVCERTIDRVIDVYTR